MSITLNDNTVIGGIHVDTPDLKVGDKVLRADRDNRVYVGTITNIDPLGDLKETFVVSIEKDNGSVSRYAYTAGYLHNVVVEVVESGETVYKDEVRITASEEAEQG